MRVIFEIARLFAVVAVFGLMAANSGCAKPENDGAASAPAADMGEAGSTMGGGAEVPEAGDEPVSDEPAADGEGEAPAEGDAPAEAEVTIESDAPAKVEVEVEKPAETE